MTRTAVLNSVVLTVVFSIGVVAAQDSLLISDQLPITNASSSLVSNRSDCVKHGSKCTGCQKTAKTDSSKKSACETPARLIAPFGDGIQVGGWISGGVTFNEQDNRNRTGNFPVRFGDASYGALANQIWGFIEREADNGGSGVDWGFRADYVYGSDGPDTQAFGDRNWDYGWNSSGDYGSAVPQLYFDLAIDNLSVRLGHFQNFLSYETVPAPSNFFYSHALTMAYGESMTNTGVLAEYYVNPCVTLFGGWTMGWDSGFDNQDDANLILGGFSWSPNDQLIVDYKLTAGNFGDGNPVNEGNLFMHSLVVQYQVNDQVDYVMQSDFAINFDRPSGDDTQWYGINNYLYYQINSCWLAGVRAEWFRDQDGARTGTAGDYYEATVGLNWQPTNNLRVRPEARWDVYEGVGTPFHSGTDTNITTFGIDFVWQF